MALPTSLHVKNRPTLGVRRNFELVLPPILKTQVEPGDYFRATLVRGALVLRPTDALDPNEADQDIASGRIAGPYRTTATFMRELKRTARRSRR